MNCFLYEWYFLIHSKMFFWSGPDPEMPLIRVKMNEGNAVNSIDACLQFSSSDGIILKTD